MIETNDNNAASSSSSSSSFRSDHLPRHRTPDMMDRELSPHFTHVTAWNSNRRLGSKINLLSGSGPRSHGHDRLHLQTEEAP